MASIAAGNAQVSVQVNDQRLGSYGGVAPQARVAAYKACWTAPDPADDGCSTADLVTAVDTAVRDRVDVLNLSVGYERLLGQRCPSMYDLRNLFQVNVEEGRHLWAMVYLLHSYFGRDGRDEAEELLDAAQAQHPRGMIAVPILLPSLLLALGRGDLDRATRLDEQLQAVAARHGLPDGWLRIMDELRAELALWQRG